MKIAIIGSGISGLTSAYLLQKEHDVTVFESAKRIGGHTATVEVPEAGSVRAIDTGFIVFNDWTFGWVYHLFCVFVGNDAIVGAR